MDTDAIVHEKTMFRQGKYPISQLQLPSEVLTSLLYNRSSFRYPAASRISGFGSRSLQRVLFHRLPTRIQWKRIRFRCRSHRHFFTHWYLFAGLCELHDLAISGRDDCSFSQMPADDITIVHLSATHTLHFPASGM